MILLTAMTTPPHIKHAKKQECMTRQGEKLTSICKEDQRLKLVLTDIWYNIDKPWKHYFNERSEREKIYRSRSKM